MSKNASKVLYNTLLGNLKIEKKMYFYKTFQYFSHNEVPTKICTDKKNN